MRGLVDHDQVGVQRVVPVEGGVPAGAQLQQPVHGGGRVPGQLGQPLGGPPGRRGQHDLRPLRRGQRDRPSLTVNDLPQPGPPVSTATFARQRQPHRLLLLGGQLRAGPAAQPGQRLVPVDVARRRASGPPARRSSRSSAAASEVSARWNGTRYTAGIGSPSPSGRGPVSRTTPSLGGQLGQAGARPARRAPRGSSRRRRPGSARAGSSARRRRPRDSVYCRPALHPLRAVVRDPDRLGDRVGGLEPDPPHVGGQPVRLVPHHGDRRRRRTSCRSAPPARWTPRRPAGRPSPP